MNGPADGPARGLEERQVSERRLYDGYILNLRVDKVETPSGRIATREVVEHKHAVGILALTDHDSVLLVRQYRYAVGEEMLEICAGLIEKGEDPAEAAAREMQEELGYKPKTLVQIGAFYATPGFCTEFMTLFVAEGLTASSLPQDEDENVSAREVPCGDIPRLLAEGAIRDAKTFAALSWLMARKGMRPDNSL
ncbi:MAG: NUDIX hydrolase [Fretibacterium sp.]|nr:NUDIX hydrolase [Fretibacterium sp.]